MTASNIFMLWLFGYLFILFPYGMIEIKYCKKLCLRWFFMWIYSGAGALLYIKYTWGM